MASCSSCWPRESAPNVPVGRFNDEQTAVHAARGGRCGAEPGGPPGRGRRPARARPGAGIPRCTWPAGASSRVTPTSFGCVAGNGGADLHRPNARGETPLTRGGVYGQRGRLGRPGCHQGFAGGRGPPGDGGMGPGLTAIQRFTRHGGDMGWLATLLLGAGADPDHKDPRGDAPPPRGDQGRGQQRQGSGGEGVVAGRG